MHSNELRVVQRAVDRDGPRVAGGARRDRPQRRSQRTACDHGATADAAGRAGRLTDRRGSVAPRPTIASAPRVIGNSANGKWPVKSQATPPREGPKNAVP